MALGRRQMPRTSKTVTKVRLFVASPGDVASEREHLARVVSELNVTIGSYKGLTVEFVRWETHCTPAMGRPQRVITAQIGSYDVFVGVMWRRFGTPTEEADSGTEEEFRTAYNCWLKDNSVHILFYFSQKPFMPRTDEEVEQVRKVLRFRGELEEKGLIWEYRDNDDFPNVVRPHLSRVLLDMVPSRSRGRRKALQHRPKQKRPRVFIACAATDMSLAKELSEYLITIDVEGLLGSDQIEVGQSTLELWEDLPSKVDVAIFIIGTAEIEANGGRKFIPRQNLMFELGLFHAKLGRQRTIILASGAGELPTD